MQAVEPGAPPTTRVCDVCFLVCSFSGHVSAGSLSVSTALGTAVVTRDNDREPPDRL